MPQHHYSAYGLSLIADTALPNLLPLKDIPDQPDLFIHVSTDGSRSFSQTGLWQPHPRFVSRRPQDHLNEPWLKIWRDEEEHIRLEYGDGVEFIIDSAIKNLWMKVPEQFDVTYAETYLVNQGLGFVLRLKGITCLHASAVVMNGEAVLFCAPSGYGKSTLATYCALKGHPIITDDISPLRVKDGRVFVLPGYPRLRLTPETTEGFFGPDHQLALMAEGWDKYYLPLHDRDSWGKFSLEPFPVKAVYLLASWGDAPEIRPVSSARAFMQLMENAYLSYLMDSAVHIADSVVLSQLVMSSPVRQIDNFPGLPHLDLTYRAILDDLGE